MKWWAWLAIGFLVLHSVPLAAMEFEDEAGIRVQWRSESGNPLELVSAIERLYVVLYNTGNLPVREITDPEKTPQPVERLLRSEELFSGPYFPVGVDAVLCDLNAAICTRERRPVSGDALMPPTEHVGGYLKSSGQWRNGAGTALIVPDIRFETYTTFIEVPVPGAKGVDSLIAGLDTTCSALGADCSVLVQRLNPAYFDEKRPPKLRPSTIKIPVSASRMEFVLAGVEAKNNMSGKLSDIRQETTTVRIGRLDRFSPEWRDFITTYPPAEIATDALADNISSFGKVTAQGFSDALFGDQESLLRLIHHPFVSLPDLPDGLKQPVPIAVFDFGFDDTHCELKARVEVEILDAPPIRSDRPPVTRCGDVMDGSPNEALDHGTHVAGLIASEPNDDGVVGLNPFAKLHYVALDSPKLMDANYRNRVAEKMIGLGLLGASPLRVANLSWTYENQAGNVDAIRKSIETLDQNTLFVVAAGNSNQERVGDACADLPACLRNSANVISVIGLDRSENPPKLWRRDDQTGTNWGVDFGIGAIAADVLSTTYNGGTGIMSGTSQAAPQVAAAASLIYSVFEAHFRAEQPDLLPIRVKSRLIYTSDLFNELLTSVKGGRLNVERAIDLAHDRIRIRKDGEVREFQGKLVKFGNFSPGQEYIECALPGGASRQVRLTDLKRMFYDEFRTKYVVFANSQPGFDDSELERITNCDLTTRTHEAVFEAESDGEMMTFQFRDIRDFVSAMF